MWLTTIITWVLIKAFHYVCSLKYRREQAYPENSWLRSPRSSVLQTMPACAGRLSSCSCTVTCPCLLKSPTTVTTALLFLPPGSWPPHAFSGVLVVLFHLRATPDCLFQSVIPPQTQCLPPVCCDHEGLNPPTVSTGRGRCCSGCPGWPHIGWASGRGHSNQQGLPWPCTLPLKWREGGQPGLAPGRNSGGVSANHSTTGALEDQDSPYLATTGSPPLALLNQSFPSDACNLGRP